MEVLSAQALPRQAGTVLVVTPVFVEATWMVRRLEASVAVEAVQAAVPQSSSARSAPAVLAVASPVPPLYWAVSAAPG